MNKAKLLTGVLLVLAILFAQVGTVFAAPTAQDTTGVTGTVKSVVPETDAAGVTTVVVTLEDELDQAQTVRISLDDAVFLGLVTVDPVTQAVTVVDLTTLPPVIIDSTAIIPEVVEDVHPIAALLASFFGMEAGEVDALHEDGFGFGVIAQAMWMAKNLEGDATTASLILQAKRDNDFSSFTLPDGSTASNWGQFKKAVLDKKNNLGVIVSGHAESETGTEGTLSQPDNGNDKGKGKDKNKDKGKGNNKNP
jgi:hypothetical protein